MSVHENRILSQGFKYIAGVDEAGRGPLAGPVIAAACILPPKTVFANLNDSKQVSPKQRDILYRELTSAKGVLFGIGEASVLEINEINILQATFLAMQRAVEALPSPPDYLLIDGNRAPYFTMQKETLVQGDSLSVSIAAASILAKVFRDRLMEKMDEKWPMYGFGKHKGYGTKEHIEAIQKWGPCPDHRMTFAPLRDYPRIQLL
jgi:ribonuclease HII